MHFVIIKKIIKGICSSNQLGSNSVGTKFPEEKVHKAVRGCKKLKSLGQDGLKVGSVEELWDDIKGDFIRVIAKLSCTR